jgi:hypothetical protein
MDVKRLWGAVSRLWSVSGLRLRGHGGGQGAAELAGDVLLEAAPDLSGHHLRRAASQPPSRMRSDGANQAPEVLLAHRHARPLQCACHRCDGQLEGVGAEARPFIASDIVARFPALMPITTRFGRPYCPDR